MAPRFPAALAVVSAFATVLLGGCTVYPYDDKRTSMAAARAASANLRTGALPERTRAVRLARQGTKPIVRGAAGMLKPRNQAKFVVLEGIEAVGRSRSYTGEQLDPDRCAEQCLATIGCDAFSFDIETMICSLVREVTAYNPSPSFLSGRLNNTALRGAKALRQ